MAPLKQRINAIFFLLLVLFSFLIFLIVKQSYSIFNVKEPQTELLSAADQVQQLQVILRNQNSFAGDDTVESSYQQLVALPKYLLELKTADKELRDYSLAVSLLIDKHVAFQAKGETAGDRYLANYLQLMVMLENIESHLQLKLKELSERTRQDTISFYQLLTILFVSILIVSIAAYILLRRNLKTWVDARDQIRESERKFRVLAETAYDAIIMSDAESNILFFNKAAERIFGYSFSEVNGLKLNTLFPDHENTDDQDGIQQYIKRGESRLSGYTTEITARRKSGQDFPAEVSLGPWKSGGQLYFVSVIRDITQRRKLQELIYSYANEVFDLYNGAPCGYHSINKKGFYMEINQTELDWLGYEKNEVIRLKKLTDVMTPWSAGKFENKFKELLKGVNLKNEEFEFIRKDGSTFPVLISAIAIMDSDGKFLRTRSTVLDITQRKQQEEAEFLHRTSERNLQQLEDAYNQLESFSYMASHDLKSPLNSLEGLIQMFNKSENFNGKEAVVLEKMKFLVINMRQLIDDLLAFSRIDKAVIQKSNVVMNDVVSEVVGEIRSQSDFKNAQIEVEEIVPAKGDASLLKVVWTNLLSNAVKYSSRNKNAMVKVNSYIRNGENVYSVMDNGIGFDMKDYNKLFSVFKRLNSAQDFPGTGIGLASVKRVIEKHNGRVWAESSPGNGSVFYFTLPR